MSARELLSAMAFALATGETPKHADWYPDPRSFEAAIDAFRAEVLNEAATEIDSQLRDGVPVAGFVLAHSAQEASALLRAMATNTTQET